MVPSRRRLGTCAALVFLAALQAQAPIAEDDVRGVATSLAPSTTSQPAQADERRAVCLWVVRDMPSVFERTLTCLESRFRVSFVDVGAGDLLPHSEVLRPDLDRYIDQIEEHRKQLGAEQIFIAGHGNEGLVALAYAGRFPSRCMGAIVVATPGPESEDVRQEQIARFMKRKHSLQAAGHIPAPQKADGSLQASVGDQKKGMLELLPLAFHSPDAGEKARPIFREAECRPLESICWDLRDRLGRIAAPVVILSGQDDVGCIPPQAQALHFALRNSKLVLIEEAGHYPWLEQEARFAAGLDGALDALVPQWRGRAPSLEGDGSAGLRQKGGDEDGR